MMNATQQGPFTKSFTATPTGPALNSSQGQRVTPNMVKSSIDYESIRGGMQTSPKSIKPTDKRLEFLLKAKASRQDKKMKVSLRQNSLDASVSGPQQPTHTWAAQHSLSPKRVNIGNSAAAV